VGDRGPVFIVGCPRSGTTLLRDLLGAHPALTFPPESHFIPRFYRAYGDPRSERDARRLGAAILRTSWIREWGLALAPADFASCRSYRDVVSRLFEAWARQAGKRRWGDKTPQYVTDVPTLLEIFPAAKVVHIHRDGRDVALSWMGFRYGPGNVFAAARAWKAHVEAGRRAGSAAPPASYREVRYETLVSEPDTTVRSLYEFLEEADAPIAPPPPQPLPPNPFWIGRQKRSSAGDAVTTASCGRWKTAMSTRDRALFESVAGDLLRELGYETEGLARAVSPAERLGWRLQDATWRIFWRLNRKHKREWVPGEVAMRWAEMRRRFRAPRAGRRT
jgi:hypothetical protein